MILANIPLMSSHPRGLFTLIFAGFLERFSFYGTLTILLLYLTQFFSFSDTNAYATWGAFIALGYITPAVGGLLADYIAGFDRTLMIGSVLMILGYLLLAFQTTIFLYVGLSLLLCGSGFFKGPMSSMVGMLYAPGDVRRHGAYSKYFVGMGLGAIAGPFLFGFMTLNFNWRILFLLSAVGNAFGLILFMWNQKEFDYPALPRPPQILASRLMADITVKHALYAGLILTILLVSILFAHPVFGNNVMGGVSIAALFMPVLLVLKDSLGNIKKMIGFTVLNFLLALYYAAIFQTSGPVIMGLEREFQLEFFGMVIPATTFTSMQYLFAIIITPFLTKFWFYLSQKYFEPSFVFKIGMGLFCAGVGFGLLAFVFVSKLYPLLNITLASIFLGLSVAAIMPVHLLVVSQYAPTHLQGTLMGVSYLSDALGGYIGSNMTKYAYSFASLIRHPSIYADTYLSIAVLMIGLALLWFSMASLLRFLFDSE